MMATGSLAQLNPRRQSATVILAQLAARNAVKRQIQRQGRVKLSMVPYGEITRLAERYLAEHRELLAQAALSPIVQNLKDKHRKRRSDPQRELLCASQVQNSVHGGGE
jgi:hypothetical protein